MLIGDCAHPVHAATCPTDTMSPHEGTEKARMHLGMLSTTGQETWHGKRKRSTTPATCMKRKAGTRIESVPERSHVQGVCSSIRCPQIACNTGNRQKKLPMKVRLHKWDQITRGKFSRTNLEMRTSKERHHQCRLSKGNKICVCPPEAAEMALRC